MGEMWSQSPPVPGQKPKPAMSLDGCDPRVPPLPPALREPVPTPQQRAALRARREREYQQRQQRAAYVLAGIATGLIALATLFLVLWFHRAREPAPPAAESVAAALPEPVPPKPDPPAPPAEPPTWHDVGTWSVQGVAASEKFRISPQAKAWRLAWGVRGFHGRPPRLQFTVYRTDRTLIERTELVPCGDIRDHKTVERTYDSTGDFFVEAQVVGELAVLLVQELR